MNSTTNLTNFYYTLNIPRNVNANDTCYRFFLCVLCFFVLFVRNIMYKNYKVLNSCNSYLGTQGDSH